MDAAGFPLSELPESESTTLEGSHSQCNGNAAADLCYDGNTSGYQYKREIRSWQPEEVQMQYNYILVFITVPSAEVGSDIATLLVEENLAWIDTVTSE